jgi:lyso-ornithine lipid O-acyltransferase
MMGNIHAAVKLLLLTLWIGFWYPPVWLSFRLGKSSARDRMSKICNQGLLHIIGIRLTVSGALSKEHPLLLVSNHTSYLDIPILASQSALCFTPKSEIASWPIIGGISKISGAVFIDRRPEKMMGMKKQLQDALASKRIVSLFPEATTGNGLHMQPFKSGFFSLADTTIDDQHLIIQPACICYSHIRGLPIDSSQWPLVAWYGDMDLAPHAWALFKLGPISAQLTFLPPVHSELIGDRKKVAAYCHHVINNEIQSLRGNDAKAAHEKILPFSPRALRIKS